MIVKIAKVLDPRTLTEIQAQIDGLTFVDGRATAGWNAKLVKDNLQARPDAALERVRTQLADAIAVNPVFQLAVRAKAMTPLMIARYGERQSYGVHVDDALMQGMRTDVSFTLFLADPASYEGGELVIETPGGEDAVKLPAGDLVAYPATSLHRVEPVRSGMRCVAVGWARSFIRSTEQRELLFDLETTRRTLFARHGKTPEFDLLSKSVANLLRMWVDD